ncbi:ATP-binding cassette domain-containing protein [uncultured Idiomarina sp.]|uniref:ATP-binding cassette domain-containing protein n=1 Tax=Pseudoalteromonas tetraodonis TaxID=43659 RepID=UPI0025965E63|nr:ATP-binding cassette domain-containing protein [uncultured Idiomarina sp.]
MARTLEQLLEQEKPEVVVEARRKASDILDTLDEQAKSAAKLARVDAYIESQPEGYNTFIEESGANLSRGQKQRIALARALVLNPKILLLDEATASVDVITEKAIRNMIEELQGVMTVVIIAHQWRFIEAFKLLVLLIKKVNQ